MSVISLGGLEPCPVWDRRKGLSHWSGRARVRGDLNHREWLHEWWDPYWGCSSPGLTNRAPPPSPPPEEKARVTFQEAALSNQKGEALRSRSFVLLAS